MGHVPRRGVAAPVAVFCRQYPGTIVSMTVAGSGVAVAPSRIRGPFVATYRTDDEDVDIFDAVVEIARVRDLQPFQAGMVNSPEAAHRRHDI
jgi:hypothetical protein